MFNLDLPLTTVGILVSIAMLTLMERKVMSYIQTRKGPSKVILWGISQPLADAVKLFTKKNISMNFTMKNFFQTGPILGMVIMVFLWIIFPSWWTSLNSQMNFMMMFAVMSISAYFLFFSGYSSSSMYTMMGFIRTISQTISYEVTLTLFVMVMVYLFETMNPHNMKNSQESLSFLWVFLPMILLWSILALSESNRSPFDFSEGESEIVSGFNTEFNGALFSIIFISEYGMMIFMTLLGSMFIMGSGNMETVMSIILTLLIWARCSFPRYRYDLLMNLSWKIILPISITMMITTMEISQLEKLLNI